MTGTELKALRKTAKLSQAALAEKVGVARNTITRYESGDLPILKPMELALLSVLNPDAKR